MCWFVRRILIYYVICLHQTQSARVSEWMEEKKKHERTTSIELRCDRQCVCVWTESNEHEKLCDKHSIEIDDDDDAEENKWFGVERWAQFSGSAAALAPLHQCQWTMNKMYWGSRSACHFLGRLSYSKWFCIERRALKTEEREKKSCWRRIKSSAFSIISFPIPVSASPIYTRTMTHNHFSGTIDSDRLHRVCVLFILFAPVMFSHFCHLHLCNRHR